MHYYDTMVYSYFLSNPNVKHEFSPTNNGQIQPAISLIAVEEFLHTHLKIKETDDYYELWYRVELLNPFFDVIGDLKLSDINDRFNSVVSRLLNFARAKGLNYNEMYLTESIPEMMDVLHLVIADLSGAVFFLTGDTKFDFFGQIADLPLKNLTEIIILDRNDNFKRKGRPIILHHAV